ncbi:hypothetical protein ACLJYM_09955 [Rhizobium giardinii]|uniref:hypothetical protein n=1 Tax=Rhizobium giardinii TaxID=56731 RepID=UPI0039E0D6DB
MTKLEQIEKSASELGPEELREFAAWLTHSSPSVGTSSSNRMPKAAPWTLWQITPFLTSKPAGLAAFETSRHSSVLASI